MVDRLVLVDTDAFSKVVLRRRDSDPRSDGWRKLLTGWKLTIAAQSEAEMRYGALLAQWGEPRMAALAQTFRRVPTLPVTEDVITSFATIRVACHRAGHPLAAKAHMGDAWVAATAHAYDLPLLAGDQIYREVPGLLLLEDAS
ncbi:PIN domain-containing protein [Branchiibius cervicis]|uniref:PIN domain-containing protein n=1 Tax=Branchiibius cervicis TaxID=908252 RepID=A0ABW2AVP6_9MICO